MKTERNILLKASLHPFLIELKQCFQTHTKLYFVLEYCPGGELFNLLKKKKRFTEDQTRFYVCQIVLALEHLHKHEIIYRDLKPENILIGSDGYIKITDFGLSKISESLKEAKTICGTAEYLAPEILFKLGYGKEIDWWTLGCLTFELIVGLPPFQAHSKEELDHKIKFSTPKFPNYLSSSCLDLILQLLKKDPVKRLGTKSVEDIKKHIWFENVNWEVLLQKKYEPFFLPKISEDLGLGNFSSEFTEISLNSFSLHPNSNYHYVDDFDWNGVESDHSTG